MINYEALRENPAYKRDIYSDLKRIEERGKLKKEKREEKKLARLLTRAVAAGYSR